MSSWAAWRTAATLSRAEQLGLLVGGLGQVLAEALLDLAEQLSSTAIGATSHLGLPAAFCSSSCAAQRLRISSWAIWRASSDRAPRRPPSRPPRPSRSRRPCRPRRGRAPTPSVSWRVGLMMNSSPMRPMRTAPTGPANGSSDGISAAEAPLMQRMSNGVHLVDGHHRRDDLGLVAVPLRPQRPDRPVGHACGQRRPVARARLALDEAAGDLARGVHALLHIHGEGEEVRPRTRRPARRPPSPAPPCRRSAPGPSRWPAWPACPSRS